MNHNKQINKIHEQQNKLKICPYDHKQSNKYDDLFLTNK